MIFLIAHTPDGLDALLRFPPLHPMFVNFTAALVPAAVISDLLGWLLRRPVLYIVGRWTLLYAALVTPLTALTGWYWLWTGDHPVDSRMLIHQWLGTSLAVVLIPLAMWRWRAWRADAAPRGLYQVVAVIVLLAMIFQGHIGAGMTFGFGHLHPSAEVDMHDHGPNGSDAGYEWREYIDLTEVEE